jgi:hypothetical protein
MATTNITTAPTTLWLCIRFDWGRVSGARQYNLVAYYSKEQAEAKLKQLKTTWEQEAKEDAQGTIHQNDIFESCNSWGDTARFVRFYIEGIPVEV